MKSPRSILSPRGSGLASLVEVGGDSALGISFGGSMVVIEAARGRCCKGLPLAEMEVGRLVRSRRASDHLKASPRK